MSTPAGEEDARPFVREFGDDDMGTDLKEEEGDLADDGEASEEEEEKRSSEESSSESEGSSSGEEKQDGEDEEVVKEEDGELTDEEDGESTEEEDGEDEEVVEKEDGEDEEVVKEEDDEPKEEEEEDGESIEEEDGEDEEVVEKEDEEVVKDEDDEPKESEEEDGEDEEVVESEDGEDEEVAKEEDGDSESEEDGENEEEVEEESEEEDRDDRERGHGQRSKNELVKVARKSPRPPLAGRRSTATHILEKSRKLLEAYEEDEQDRYSLNPHSFMEGDGDMEELESERSGADTEGGSEEEMEVESQSSSGEEDTDDYDEEDEEDYEEEEEYEEEDDDYEMDDEEDESYEDESYEEETETIIMYVDGYEKSESIEIHSLLRETNEPAEDLPEVDVDGREKSVSIEIDTPMRESNEQTRDLQGVLHAAGTIDYHKLALLFHELDHTWEDLKGAGLGLPPVSSQSPLSYMPVATSIQPVNPTSMDGAAEMFDMEVEEEKSPLYKRDWNDNEASPDSSPAYGTRQISIPVISTPITPEDMRKKSGWPSSSTSKSKAPLPDNSARRRNHLPMEERGATSINNHKPTKKSPIFASMANLSPARPISGAESSAKGAPPPANRKAPAWASGVCKARRYLADADEATGSVTSGESSFAYSLDTAPGQAIPEQKLPARPSNGISNAQLRKSGGPSAQPIRRKQNYSSALQEQAQNRIPTKSLRCGATPAYTKAVSSSAPLADASGGDGVVSGSSPSEGSTGSTRDSAAAELMLWLSTPGLVSPDADPNRPTVSTEDPTNSSSSSQTSLRYSCTTVSTSSAESATKEAATQDTPFPPKFSSADAADNASALWMPSYLDPTQSSKAKSNASKRVRRRVTDGKASGSSESKAATVQNAGKHTTSKAKITGSEALVLNMKASAAMVGDANKKSKEKKPIHGSHFDNKGERGDVAAETIHPTAKNVELKRLVKGNGANGTRTNDQPPAGDTESSEETPGASTSETAAVEILEVPSDAKGEPEATRGDPPRQPSPEVLSNSKPVASQQEEGGGRTKNEYAGGVIETIQGHSTKEHDSQFRKGLGSQGGAGMKNGHVRSDKSQSISLDGNVDSEDGSVEMTSRSRKKVDPDEMIEAAELGKDLEWAEIASDEISALPSPVLGPNKRRRVIICIAVLLILVILVVGLILGIRASKRRGDSSIAPIVDGTNCTDNSWQQAYTLQGFGRYEGLGNAVALSADGASVAVGARDMADRQGAGYVRVFSIGRDGITESAPDILFGHPEDWGFASRLALSGDGRVVAISGSRHVRVYQLSPDESPAPTWRRLGSDILVGGQLLEDAAFVNSVSLSYDGSTLAVGFSNQLIRPPQQPFRQDGGSNSSLCDYEAVRVLSYDLSSSDVTMAWEPLGLDIVGQAKDDCDSFGGSTGLSADGNILAVGAPRSNTARGAASGEVLVYGLQRAQNSGTGQASFVNWIRIGSSISGDEENDEFGASLSITADGSCVAAGAPQSSEEDFDHSSLSTSAATDRHGYVKVYCLRNIDSALVNIFRQEEPGDWTMRGNRIVPSEAAMLQDASFGFAVSMAGEDGHTVAVGAPRARASSSTDPGYMGQVEVFRWIAEDNVWAGAGVLESDATDSFGFEVSLSANGTSLVTGTPYNSEVALLGGEVRLFYDTCPIE